MSQELEDITSSPSKVFTRRSSATLSTTSQEVLKSNPDRVAVYFTNKTAINVLIDETVAPASDEGFSLDAAGGILNFNIKEDGDLPLKSFHALSESGTPTIRIKELIRRPKGSVRNES